MAVFPPGFSERVFEFSFNAEYAAANKAVLAGAPHIPTQNEEKHLGYDVLFSVRKAGGITNALALQHKTVRKVDSVSGTNAHFCALAKAPYFAFRIDVEQFNVIQGLASLGVPGIEFYYCVPCFTTRLDMNSHYVAQSVLQHSIWIDVSASASLDPSIPHTIVYNQSATQAWVFSDEPNELKVVTPRRERLKDARRDPLTGGELRAIYESVFLKVDEYWPKQREQRQVDHGEGEVLALPKVAPTYMEPAAGDTELLRIRDLLTSYIGMSMLVELPLSKPLS